MPLEPYGGPRGEGAVSYERVNPVPHGPKMMHRWATGVPRVRELRLEGRSVGVFLNLRKPRTNPVGLVFLG